MGPAIAWIALIVMLAANVALAWAPLGEAKAFVTFAVAVFQVGVMGLVFMRLNRAPPLVRLTALAGLFWLFFLFAMSGADYFTRR